MNQMKVNEIRCMIDKPFEFEPPKPSNWALCMGAVMVVIELITKLAGFPQ